MPEDRSSPDAIAVAMRVGAAIEEAGGRYFVGGSLASSLQGEPRATNDIDVVIDLPIAKTADLVAALGDDFEVDEDALREALGQTRSCNIFYLPVVMKVDLFCVGASPFDASEFDRRKRLLVRPPSGTLVVKSRRTRCCASCSGISTVAASPTASGGTSSKSFGSAPRSWTARTLLPGPNGFIFRSSWNGP